METITVLTDPDDPVGEAVFAQRSNMTSQDWLGMDVGNSHPLEWWGRQSATVQEYKDAQRAVRVAISKTRNLLQQGTLSTTERDDLTNFLKMVSAQQGPLKTKDRMGYFLHHYVPWLSFIKQLFVGYPYHIFFVSWALILINAIVVAAVYSAWPIFATFAIPLVVTLGLVIGVMVKDQVFTEVDETDKRRLHIVTRFSAMFPIIAILWASFGCISVVGQLPVAMGSDPQLVVSRSGQVHEAITLNSGLVRFPNAWETILRGDALKAPPSVKAKDESYAVSTLPNGKLNLNFTVLPRISVEGLKGSNYDLLFEEQKNLMQKAESSILEWCASYRSTQPNTSLVNALNNLTSDHFAVRANPGKLTWTKEETVPTEKFVDKVTTEKQRVIVEEKVSRPQETLIQ